MGPQQQTLCCICAAVGPAGRRYIDRLLKQRRSSGACGQCHITTIVVNLQLFELYYLLELYEVYYK